ncbi:MAG: MarR family winged helix-turn-helix transcriptional regulator [Gammaproteobacteria bacterium]|nr:MarR family winged helix-turn-helix transcriptional regulator [Gammaproteobacteria bacterium]
MTSPKEQLPSYSEIGRTCVAFNLRRATRSLSNMYEEIMRPSGLRVTQFSVLVAIQNTGPVAMSVLAKVLAMDRTTLTRNLKPLVRDGLLIITPGEDPRSRVVNLSEKGIEQLEEAIPLWQKAQDAVDNKLADGQLDDILKTLNSLARINK